MTIFGYLIKEVIGGSLFFYQSIYSYINKEGYKDVMDGGVMRVTQVSVPGPDAAVGRLSRR